MLSTFNWHRVKLRLKFCSPYFFVYFSTFIWTLSWMWNARIPQILKFKWFMILSQLVYSFAFWLKRERIPLRACWSTFMGRQIFLVQHWKCLQKRLIILMFFTCNIWRKVVPPWKRIAFSQRKTIALSEMQWEWSVSSYKKRYISECLQIFPAGRSASTYRWGEEVLYDFLGRSVQYDPRTLSFYHSMFSCNSTSLAIL